MLGELAAGVRLGAERAGRDGEGDAFGRSGTLMKRLREAAFLPGLAARRRDEVIRRTFADAETRRRVARARRFEELSRALREAPIRGGGEH
ncbi:MAG: hypothetical protein ACHQ6T_00315 [Myxococcota bacterium]